MPSESETARWRDCPKCGANAEDLELVVDFDDDDALWTQPIQCPTCGAQIRYERSEVEHPDGIMRWDYEWRLVEDVTNG